MKSNLAYIDSEAQIEDDVTISPFVVIEGKAKIGAGTFIGPNVHIKGNQTVIGQNARIESAAFIDNNVEIGENTHIYPQAIVFSGARIGKNCKIHSGAVISNIPQDLKFDGEETLAIIGDNTVLRECVTINRGTTANNQTKVGNNCLLMAYVHVAHDCIINDQCIISNSVQIAGHVEVGYHVVIGGSSAIHQFSRIGQHSMIAGGALVRKDVPPYVIAGREPIAFEGVNLVGLKRRNFEQEKIDLIREVYRIIFKSGLNNTQAITKIKETVGESEERKVVLDFIEKSERGIIRSNK